MKSNDEVCLIYALLEYTYLHTWNTTKLLALRLYLKGGDELRPKPTTIHCIIYFELIHESIKIKLIVCLTFNFSTLFSGHKNNFEIFFWLHVTRRLNITLNQVDKTYLIFNWFQGFIHSVIPTAPTHDAYKIILQ